jgi:hypothetical protein
MTEGSRDVRSSETYDSESQSLFDLAVLLSPAIVVLAATFLVYLFAGKAEAFLLVQSSGRIVARFFSITAILLAPMLILPLFISFLGMTPADKFPFGSIVIGKARVQFSRSLLWGIRPLQGIGMSFMFESQLLNLFNTYPETSFVSALVRPVLFIIVSIPFSMLFSTIWSLDDLGVKVYLKNTDEVRLIGGYVGTILPVVSGAFGIYSLFQRGFSPTDALVMLVLVALVLYPPYALFAVSHNRFLCQRRTRLIESLRFASIEVHMKERGPKESD